MVWFSWPGENVGGQTKRAVAVAMQITIGDLGAIAGSFFCQFSFTPAHTSHPN